MCVISEVTDVDDVCIDRVALRPHLPLKPKLHYFDFSQICRTTSRTKSRKHLDMSRRCGSVVGFQCGFVFCDLSSVCCRSSLRCGFVLQLVVRQIRNKSKQVEFGSRSSRATSTSDRKTATIFLGAAPRCARTVRAGSVQRRSRTPRRRRQSVPSGFISPTLDRTRVTAAFVRRETSFRC